MSRLSEGITKEKRRSKEDLAVFVRRLPMKSRLPCTCTTGGMVSAMSVFCFRNLVRAAWLSQLGKFVIVGSGNTLVDLGSFYLLIQTSGFVNHPVYAKVISYSIGILNSFFWNRFWTFRSGVAIAPSLALFVFFNLGSLFLNAGAMYLGLTTLDLPREFALALATMSALALNFLVSKFVVFRS